MEYPPNSSYILLMMSGQQTKSELRDEIESMRCKLARMALATQPQECKPYLDEDEYPIALFDLDGHLSEILSAHLKLFMANIIKCMAMHKKKCLLPSPLLNKKQDPKNPHGAMSSNVVYENSKFTPKDFLDMLRANERIIPPRPIYNLYIERLLNYVPKYSYFMRKKKMIKENVEKEKNELSHVPENRYSLRKRKVTKEIVKNKKN